MHVHSDSPSLKIPVGFNNIKKYGGVVGFNGGVILPLTDTNKDLAGI